MTIKGTVMNASEETRELVGKDGVKKSAKVTHILMFFKSSTGATFVYKVRAYDATFTLPAVGKDWESPDIKKYECYDGQVAEVMI